MLLHVQEHCVTPQDKRDRHEGELGQATIALFMIPMFGEGIPTIILKYQQRDTR